MSSRPCTAEESLKVVVTGPFGEPEMVLKIRFGGQRQSFSLTRGAFAESGVIEDDAAIVLLDRVQQARRLPLEQEEPTPWCDGHDVTVILVSDAGVDTLRGHVPERASHPRLCFIVEAMVAAAQASGPSPVASALLETIGAGCDERFPEPESTRGVTPSRK